MFLLKRIFNHTQCLNLFYVIFFTSQILECESTCKLVDSSPTEKQLLEKLKPLNGHTFEAKDLLNPANYSYKINICDKVDGQADGVGAVQFANDNIFVLGRYDKVEIIGGNNWMFLTYYGGDMYKHHCNQSERVTTIMISCIPDIVFGRLEILEEKHSNMSRCYYLFELESNVSCTSYSKNGDRNHTTFGSVFCILFFTFGSFYLILGFLYKRFVVGAKGLEQIPNYSFWKEFGNLQADGCDFVCRCGPRQESQAYRGIDDHLKMEDERDDQLLNM